MITRHIRNISLVFVLAIAVSGCGAMGRLKDVGKAPDLTPIQNPVAQKNYQPVRMPMPAPERVVYQPNSLWASGARAFLKTNGPPVSAIF